MLDRSGGGRENREIQGQAVIVSKGRNGRDTLRVGLMVEYKERVKIS